MLSQVSESHQWSLHEPFLAAALGEGRSREECAPTAGVLLSASGTQLFSRPLGAALLTVEATAHLFRSIIEFFRVYVLW